MSVASKKTAAPPDLSHFRKRYPLTVTHFGGLADREAWLRRVWQLDINFINALERQDKKNDAEEIIVRGTPPADLHEEATFDIIYAGGVLGLLHAAVMACRYQQRVLVLDAHLVGRTHRDWNISDEELREFNTAGLFTSEELEAAIVNRYRSGFVKFHDASSRVKTPALWMDNVLDVAVDADDLLSLAARKLREGGPHGCALFDHMRLVRCYVQLERVSVEVEDARTGRRRMFGARLVIDATGTNSPIARQLNSGQAITHVCPTVGTVARGFARGAEPHQVDFNVGEILVSTEDASDHRQLIWEGFAGNPARDDYTTYLFFYDAINSPADKSLLALFERYFESLPNYKRPGANWRVAKPVFGYIPSFHHRGWHNKKRTAVDRAMLIGDAAGLSSPLTFCGFGSHVRNLNRLTKLTAQALHDDALDESSLQEINAYEPRVAQMAGFAEFLRPTPRGAPAAVNETLNAVMAALHSLDERVRRELFQDRMSFGALKNLLTGTAQIYPRIFGRVREHLGARGTFWWIANIAEAVLSERKQLNGGASIAEEQISSVPIQSREGPIAHD